MSIEKKVTECECEKDSEGEEGQEVKDIIEEKGESEEKE